MDPSLKKDRKGILFLEVFVWEKRVRVCARARLCARARVRTCARVAQLSYCVCDRCHVLCESTPLLAQPALQWNFPFFSTFNPYKYKYSLTRTLNLLTYRQMCLIDSYVTLSHWVAPVLSKWRDAEIELQTRISTSEWILPQSIARLILFFLLFFWWSDIRLWSLIWSASPKHLKEITSKKEVSIQHCYKKKRGLTSSQNLRCNLKLPLNLNWRCYHVQTSAEHINSHWTAAFVDPRITFSSSKTQSHLCLPGLRAAAVWHWQ